MRSEKPENDLTRKNGKGIIPIEFNLYGGKNMEITKDSLIGDVLDMDVETAQFFFEIGMHCLGCPHSRGESIEDACAVHGTDADALVEKINAFLASKK